ncbi:hypothetical protein BTR14_13075 [Rhizobium rhizosphaerae]|uniref:Uncharacterized protein n=1 Tax=Xaviernesmea rhizosphaerae TaxID=1672749 RepID=A0ABX3PC11_9HYPH|nr:hypothetical protein [Xaviernesmea rhizosphaerae]OQP86009.1 hypothetical protein BTR14_13075 [Xaviernesmea rhizosphaerae]
MNVWLELIRLAAQLVGAIFVAKLAVQWALLRFKSEKSWERQVTAIVDVVTAMGAMKRVSKRWLDDFYSDSNTTEPYMAQLRALHREAELKLEQVSAAARLILPEKLANHIELTERKLRSIDDCPNYEEMLILELEILDNRSEELITMGREITHTDRTDPPDAIIQPWKFLLHRKELRKSHRNPL